MPAAVKLKIALCLLCSPRRPFDIPLNEPELFTDNLELRRWLAADPLRLRKATARFLFVSRALDRIPDLFTTVAIITVGLVVNALCVYILFLVKKLDRKLLIGPGETPTRS